MNLIRRLFMLAAIGGALSPVSAKAATANLTRGVADAAFYPGGYAGVADNDIFYYAPFAGSGHPAEPSVWMRSSDGAYGTVRGSNSSSSIRTLYRFDLSGMSGQSTLR